MGLGGQYFTEKETGPRMLHVSVQGHTARMTTACDPVSAPFIPWKVPQGQVPGGLPSALAASTPIHGPLSPATHLLLLPILSLVYLKLLIPFPLNRKSYLHFIHPLSQICFPKCLSLAKQYHISILIFEEN